ncbi:heme-binding protein 2-like [Pecten maximus]|uniref:heme-binding protein 2-like n=1 Tax=Pecten maximus TaxID=6579 RepID=UPI00145817C6|nr:heme-binding protein 2-like [Pecten maximus]
MMLLSVFVVMVTGATAFSFKQLDGNSLDSQPLIFHPHGYQEALKKHPDFCNGLGCPDYSVVYENKTGKFELREYAESEWVTTYSAGMDYDKAGYTNFRKLFNYIDGKNAKKEKVAMTCPVIVRVSPGPGPACTSNFTMSFFVDPAAKTPPKPSTEDIYMTTIPALKAYVRTFSGFADYDKYKEQGLELIAAIGNPSLYISDYYYTAGYDSPFKLLNRHNEVWLIAK